MTTPRRFSDRRTFLKQAGLGLGVGVTASWGPTVVPEALARATGPRSLWRLDPARVQFRPEIEPIVRFIEDTAREHLIEEAAHKLKTGAMAPADLTLGVFLAGIRNVKPRPVGFKFHTVLSLYSAHSLSLAADPEDRLLPLFWALDTFKSSQAADVREGDWNLAAVDEARLTTPDQAIERLTAAFDAWDDEGADLAAAAVARTQGAAAAMEPFWRAAVRDQRNIGHKPIFAMQCWRTLQTFGWQHAEPTLRSLAFGLLDLQGDRSRVPLGPYASSLEQANTLRDDWTLGRLDAGATRSLVDTLRTIESDRAPAAMAEAINKGLAPEAAWDAVRLVAMELLMRKPGIVSLHAVTATNALRAIFTLSSDPTTRRLSLLQAAGWLPLYRNRVGVDPDAPRIDALQPVDSTAATDSPEALQEIFEAVSRDRGRAAGLALGFVKRGGDPEALFSAARRLIVRKGRDSHDYKFQAAAWEEARLAADLDTTTRLAAASLFNAIGSRAPDAPVIERARAALA
ncbi:hypothetical protein Isop_2471 [Isosphaera pallida ATCC 43644]|uniref:Twin-arginine translocation signal domain-containing protein n=1 Tax=Isosphaera pallida (strain ATCC 43644 / DSM 9630 / IS1B) TaxID=575540 RepID=E8QXJ6_ISOPI|nr:hypothetical protein [Isosphaera pallida]ADV63044.1 hypothetical protein Isop_2471 [Isosphaera pallida ATCC 43644]